jgi:tRNA1(Val) A37 N6-methylase TrmN6
MASAAEPAATLDRLLGGRIGLLQPRVGYRVAIDPVLLAAAVPARAARILDAGAGTAAAALCLAARRADAALVALELVPELAALARRNVELAGLAARIEVVTGDLLAPPKAVTAAAFDAVMTNPPFNPPGRGTPPRSATRRAAHEESTALADWIAACLRRLRPQGWLVVIHRADRLDALLAALHGRAGTVTIAPLWAGPPPKPARRVLVRARKGGRGPARLVPGLVLHGSDGHLSPAAERILRDAAALDLDAG